MTLVLNPHGGLQQLQFGVNELTSAFVIGKLVGSCFSRDGDAKIFDVLEKNFDVRVTKIPIWLQFFQFSREGVVHGQQMRRLPCPNLMNHVEIESLEGIASVVVLCCRYAESAETIAGYLEDIIGKGKTSAVINPGKLADKSRKLPFTLRALLVNFVRATIDSDASSPQKARVMKWMAELAIEVGVSAKLSFGKERLSQCNQDLIRRLIGDRNGPVVSESSEWDDLSHIPDQTIVHTLSMGTASIALAAAANGADVTLQCMTPKGIKCIPDRQRPSQFVVRLWLRQPPPQISNILQYTEAQQSADGESNTEGQDIPTTIVFGGQYEVALHAAREIGFGYPEDSPGYHDKRCERIRKLWTGGVGLGLNMQWKILGRQGRPSRRFHRSRLRFGIEVHDSILCVPRQAAFLAELFSAAEKRLASISRAIAMVVHDEYCYDDYSSDKNYEFIEIMNFVSIAVSVGCLHALTFAPANDLSQYALNLKAVQYGGCLRELLPRIVNGEGVGHEDLLWVAVSLWGGASWETQGRMKVDPAVLGIIAPHCTVILDIIRDPIGFARRGFPGPLLSMCRGSMPMIARDPQTGFITAADVRYKARNPLQCDEESISSACLPNSLLEVPPWNKENPLVISLEPDNSAGSYKTLFCGWYCGDLVFELNPYIIFYNLMSREHHTDFPVPAAHDTCHTLIKPSNRIVRSERYKYIDQATLIRLGQYRANAGWAIFNTYSSPMWLFVAAGCAAENRVVVHRGPFDIENCLHEDGDTIIYFHGER